MAYDEGLSSLSIVFCIRKGGILGNVVCLRVESGKKAEVGKVKGEGVSYLSFALVTFDALKLHFTRHILGECLLKTSAL